MLPHGVHCSAWLSGERDNVVTRHAHPLVLLLVALVLAVVGPLEGVTAEEHHVQHHARAPDVDLRGVLNVQVGDYLRRCAARRRALSELLRALERPRGREAAQRHTPPGMVQPATPDLCLHTQLSIACTETTQPHARLTATPASQRASPVAEPAAPAGAPGRAPVYPGVPTRDLGTLSFCRCFEYPKSQIFISGRLLWSSSVFSSFMSRFTTPCARRTATRACHAASGVYANGACSVHCLAEPAGNQRGRVTSRRPPVTHGVPPRVEGPRPCWGAHHLVAVVQPHDQLLEEPPRLVLLRGAPRQLGPQSRS